MSWRGELATLPDAEERQTETFYAHLVFARQTVPDNEFLEGLIMSLELSPEQRAHLLSQPRERLLLYRTLIRNTLRSVIEKAIPRAATRLQEQFAALFDSFLDTVAITTHCLRDVTPSFLEFLETDGQVSAPFEPYILELARLEAVRIQVAAHPDQGKTTSGELDLERGLLIHPSCHMLQFDYAVHRLPDDEEDRTAPEQVPTRLLSYRDQENTVRYLELSPVAYRVLQKLSNKRALGSALVESCTEEDVALDEAVLNGTATLLADLAERGVVLGAL